MIYRDKSMLNSGFMRYSLYDNFAADFVMTPPVLRGTGIQMERSEPFKGLFRHDVIRQSKCRTRDRFQDISLKCAFSGVCENASVFPIMIR